MSIVEESFYLKLEHAFEIRDQLRDLLAEEATKTRPTRFENNATDPTASVVWAQWVAEEAPDHRRAALLLGDAIHNMRAALDHAIWSVTPEQVRQDQPRRVEFPLHVTEKAYNSWVKIRRDWYGDMVLAVMEASQPFHASTNQIHPLHLLQHLSNTDKHRLLNVVAHNQVAGAQIAVLPTPGRLKTSVNEGVVSAGTVLARVEFQRPVVNGPAGHVDIKGVFAYEQVVRYIDAAEQEHWLHIGEALNQIGPLVCETVGYLVNADRKDKGLPQLSDDNPQIT
ncbi:hypothetical protein ACFROC_05630 [Nocardia tengchongensis]|uniref:hypothetical protein n=1 Tax=Nocardia tengchongensis TaxID=2055889 RepID=UPI0036B820F7